MHAHECTLEVPTYSPVLKMSTSCASESAATSGGALLVSTKPWFVTLSEETRDVFVWKNRIRLQFRDQSTGEVR